MTIATPPPCLFRLLFVSHEYPHYDDIVEYLKNISVDFDIIALSETWFVPEKHNLSNYSLNNYTLYTSSRDNKTGGGVAIHAHDKQKISINNT